MSAATQPVDRRAVCGILGKHDEHELWWSHQRACQVTETEARAEAPRGMPPLPYHCVGRTADLARPCSDRYIDSGYRARPSVLIPCMREADEPGLQHRGQHQGWQPMPAGDNAAVIKYRPDAELESWGPWLRLWTWHRGGAAGDNRQGSQAPHEPCPLCGVLTKVATDGGIRYPGAPDAYAVGNANLGGACFDCRLWAERVVEYTAGWQRQARGLHRQQRMVRTRDEHGRPSWRLSCWVQGHTGASGDRACTVTWDDGDTRGPASSLWDCGEIPWWLDDQFPPNATVTWGM